MSGKSFGQVAAVVDSYDFSSFRKIADIGGGRGHLLQAILQKWPDTNGVLFEQQHVIDEIRDDLASDRIEVCAEDLFVGNLPAADVYVLMELIHDWTDEESLRILGSVRDAAPSGAKLLLIEQLMPETLGPHWVKMLTARARLNRARWRASGR